MASGPEERVLRTDASSGFIRYFFTSFCTFQFPVSAT